MTGKGPPPLLDPARHALFLDFDGSLVDFALTPGEIVVAQETVALLENVSRRFGGALAIITGRRIANIDSHLAPLKLPAAGVHGLEFRATPGAAIETAEASDELNEARRRLAGVLGPSDRIYVEDKLGALVLHYRTHPDQRLRAEHLAAQSVENLKTLRVVGGKAIFEIRQRDITKADAVHRFMQQAPFRARAPVFVGDDVTDEDGMRGAAAEGGFGIKIGPGKSMAAFRLPDAQAVHEWLSRLADRSDGSGTPADSAR